MKTSDTIANTIYLITMDYIFTDSNFDILCEMLYESEFYNCSELGTKLELVVAAL
ncbi:MAG TPA: hypothetical protein VIK55_11030 [Paludibacter sp.]